jgi:hypothetical protein
MGFYLVAGEVDMDVVRVPAEDRPEEMILEGDVLLKKQQRIEKEKKELLASLATGDFSSQRSRVAAILNQYPASRNSDVTLALKYWSTFQPDLYNEAGILPRDMFKLERLHYIVRARAKIQNEYGLFLADPEIKRRRRANEEKMEQAVLEDAAPRHVVKVFSDETGKNQRFVSVASVWVLSGRAVFTLDQAIRKWQESSRFSGREVHFASFGRKDIDTLQEYLEVVLANREFLSFKVVAVERARTRRSIEEVVQKLHEFMLIRGAEHEVESGRMSLPREMEVVLDEEQSLDPFVLSDLKNSVASACEAKYEKSLHIESIQAVSSRNSSIVQLADVVAGAVNRRLNHDGDRNFKDDMADMIFGMLDLNFAEEGLPGLDASALFKV